MHDSTSCLVRTMCPHPQCRVTISRGQTLCRHHWHTLPAKYRAPLRATPGTVAHGVALREALRWYQRR